MSINGRKFNDETWKLPIAHIRAKGLLRLGTNKGTLYSATGMTVCDIEVEMKEDGIAIAIFSHGDVSTAEKYEYPVAIETVRCRYGGSRYFFRCPLCRSEGKPGRRASVLYFSDRGFCCRECCGIVYRSRVRPAEYRKRKKGY